MTLPDRSPTIDDTTLVTIQRHVRGMIARRAHRIAASRELTEQVETQEAVSAPVSDCQSPVSDRLSSEAGLAAVTIQRHARGLLSRKHRRPLRAASVFCFRTESASNDYQPQLLVVNVKPSPNAPRGVAFVPGGKCKTSAESFTRAAQRELAEEVSVSVEAPCLHPSWRDTGSAHGRC